MHRAFKSKIARDACAGAVDDGLVATGAAGEFVEYHAFDDGPDGLERVPAAVAGDEDVALKVRTVKIGPDLSLQAVMAQNDQGEAFVIDLSDNSDGRAEVQRVQA